MQHLLAIDEHLEMIDDGRRTKTHHDLVIVPTKEITHSPTSSLSRSAAAGTQSSALSEVFSPKPAQRRVVGFQHEIPS
jgi:hypothetical protein